MIKRTTEDALFSEIIRERDQWQCQCCGVKGKQLDCAHILSRKFKRLRHEFRNAITLCRSCHTEFGARPTEFAAFVNRMVGEPNVDELHRLSREVFKTDRHYKSELRAHLKEQLAMVKAQRESNFKVAVQLVEFN